MDLSPIRESRGFRLLFAGQLVGVFGSQLTAVAIPFQVYVLTRSSLQVGLVSMAQLVPLIGGALIGGTVGDAIDRRHILLVTSALLALTTDPPKTCPGRPDKRICARRLISRITAGHDADPDRKQSSILGQGPATLWRNAARGGG